MVSSAFNPSYLRVGNDDDHILDTWAAIGRIDGISGLWSL